MRGGIIATELVNSKNFRDFGVGFSGPEVTEDGMFAESLVFIADQEAIDRAVKYANLYKCLYKPWDEEDLINTIKNGLNSQ